MKLNTEWKLPGEIRGVVSEQEADFYPNSPDYLGKNNTVCSCWMCGNPRKYFGEVTRQEKMAEIRETI